MLNMKENGGLHVPNITSLFLHNVFSLSPDMIFSSADVFNMDKFSMRTAQNDMVQNFFADVLTLYHTIANFINSVKENLLKILWEKEKMIMTSIFSFAHNVLTLPKTNSFISVTFKLPSANVLKLVKLEVLLFTKRQNFRVVQIESICI